MPVKESNAQRSPLGGTSNSGQSQARQRGGRRRSNSAPPPPAPPTLPPDRPAALPNTCHPDRRDRHPRPAVVSGGRAAGRRGRGGAEADAARREHGHVTPAVPATRRTSHSRRGARGPHGAVVRPDAAAAAAHRQRLGPGAWRGAHTRAPPLASVSCSFVCSTTESAFAKTPWTCETTKLFSHDER